MPFPAFVFIFAALISLGSIHLSDIRDKAPHGGPPPEYKIQDEDESGAV